MVCIYTLRVFVGKAYKNRPRFININAKKDKTNMIGLSFGVMFVGV